MDVRLEFIGEILPKKPSCPKCDLLVCSCSDEVRKPQFDIREFNYNKEALKRANKIKLADLSRFPLN